MSTRFLTIADVSEQLQLSSQAVRALIRSGSGHHFDPDVVTAFDRHFDAFVTIAERYQDGSEAVDG